jgi:hypothetical protein
MERSDKWILKTLQEQVELLRKYRVLRIGLFGSYARNEQKHDSDIDLLVEFDLSTFEDFSPGTYSPIPDSRYRISPGPPDSRAKGIHACQDAQTPPGPSIARNNAMVDVAFPLRHKVGTQKTVISKLNVRETCLRFLLSTLQPRC